MKCNIFDIWETYRDDLKGYIRKRVPDADDVNDILQSVLVKIANYCETKNDVKYMKAWIYRIAHNTIIDFHKQSGRTINTGPDHLNLQDSQGRDESIYDWLHHFIDNLPDKYATPLRLSDLERKPQKEVARQLGLSLEATKSRILRARKKLKQKFDECGIVEHSENQALSYTVTKSCCQTLIFS